MPANGGQSAVTVQTLRKVALVPVDGGTIDCPVSKAIFGR